MCRKGGPRCPKEASRRVDKARATYLADKSKENFELLQDAIYEYQLTRKGLDELISHHKRLVEHGDKKAAENLEKRINRLEWERAKLLKNKQCDAFCQEYAEAVGLEYPNAPVVMEELLQEGNPCIDPSKENVLKWFKRHGYEKALPLKGNQYYALKNLMRRCRHETIVNQTAATSLEAPGSQADLYPRNEHGRISEVYYASYGSNMSRERFMAYIEGGSIPGATRLYAGCMDTTPPIDDIPVKFDHPLFYALKSGIWDGGVAFLDHSQKGNSLGRAYLIKSEQFDEVVAQESGPYVKPTEIDLDEVVKKRVVEDFSRTYGTLVHVGDYNNRPVMTFTSALTQEDAMYADCKVPSTKNGKNVTFRGNSPSGNYLRMIGNGLEETFGLDKGSQAYYLVGSYGANMIATSQVKTWLNTPPTTTQKYKVWKSTEKTYQPSLYGSRYDFSHKKKETPKEDDSMYPTGADDNSKTAWSKKTQDFFSLLDEKGLD